jgi:hypothetical protein
VLQVHNGLSRGKMMPLSVTTHKGMRGVSAFWSFAFMLKIKGEIQLRNEIYIGTAI